MELITITSAELNSLRKSDYIFDPNTRKLYEYRNREGKALLLREIGQAKVTKILKNSIGNVLKVTSFQNYQIISVQDDSVSLFNSVSGEMFDVEFGDLYTAQSRDEIKKDFFNGVEISAKIFEYEEFKILIKTEKLFEQQESSETKTSSATLTSDKEQQLVKEIEKRKEKRKPFKEFIPPVKETKKVFKKKSVKKTSKKPAKKTTKKPTKKAAKKPAKKTTKKPTKKAVKKPAKKPAKKTTKKAVKKPAKKKSNRKK